MLKIGPAFFYGFLVIALGGSVGAAPAFCKMVSLDLMPHQLANGPNVLKVAFEATPLAPYMGAPQCAQYLQVGIEASTTLAVDPELEVQITETYDSYEGVSPKTNLTQLNAKLVCTTGGGYCLAALGPRTTLHLAHREYKNLNHSIRIRNLKTGEYLRFLDGTTEHHLVLPNP